jgi:regulator of replication initiation timing
MSQINDVIMNSILKEARRQVRQEKGEEFTKLKRELTQAQRELRRLRKIEKEMVNERSRLRAERGRIQTVASKAIRAYDQMLKLKTKPIGSVIKDGGDWHRISKEASALRALRKEARS